MSAQSNAMPDARFESQVAAIADISTMRCLYWSLKRELWEYRSIYLAPIGVSSLLLFGFMINAVHLPEKMRRAAAFSPTEQHKVMEQPFDYAALLIMLTTFIVAVFYCLEALHGERRDRSILFWKSLPVSDLTTVLSKACVPLLVLPILTFAITVATQWLMLLFSSIALLASGQSAAPLWTNLMLGQMWMGLLYHLLMIHSLWYSPIFGWLLLVSSWARRAPFLWASLPLLAIGVAEKLAFNTAHFAAMLQNRISGGVEGAVFTSRGMAMTAHGSFLISPGLWIGLGMSAIFLAGAARLRRYRGPI